MNARASLSALRLAFDAERFGRAYGLLADSAAPSRFTSTLPVASVHLLEAGSFVHGGCLAALCEQTNRYAARTVLPEAGPAVTAGLQVSYLSGAAGDTLVCRAEVVADGRHGLIVDSTVHALDGDAGRLVVSCRSTVAALDGRMPPADRIAAPHRPLVSSVSPPGDAWQEWARHYSQGWRRFCGMKPGRVGRGWVELSHILDDSHLDAEGFVQPELIAPFADDVGGACAYTTASAGERLASLDLSLSLLEGRTRAHALAGRARTIKAGKVVVVSNVEIFGLTSQGEHLLATAIVTATRVPGHRRALAQHSLPEGAAQPELAKGTS